MPHRRFCQAMALSAGVAIGLVATSAQAGPAQSDRKTTEARAEQRAEATLRRMSLEEKVALLHGRDGAIDEDEVDRAMADVGEDLLGLCIDTGSWLKCDDTLHDVRVDQAACEAVGVRSMIVVPLSHRGQCVGVLKAFSSEPGHFSDGDAAVLGLLSRVVGTTMYWATRYGESDLFHRATHDDLTGLANRALFMDRLHAAIAAARRNEARLAVMLLDMDGLKQVNDGHGHAAGDATLMEFAARLNQAVGERELAARLGGDEFAVLLSCAGEVDDIYALEQRLRANLARPFEVAGLLLRLSASWGVAQFPRDADGADELMALADERMFKAKRARKARAEEGQADGGLFI